jgi:hypothetical protein
MSDECGACDSNARCVLTGNVATCECNPGFTGDGASCADVDECATNNGGCAASATCVNREGGNSCSCDNGYEGDGFTCTAIYDESRAACAVREAEHPGYTTIARDVALCGGRYTAANMATACNTGWHVCKKTEWMGKYPRNRTYGETPDPTPATIGQYTSWGALQLHRCGGHVWQASAPVTADTWDDPVCYYPGDVPENGDGADYNPYNTGKYMYADDGTTVLHGVDADGKRNTGSWDVDAAETEIEIEYAVYCCQGDS